MPTWTDYKNHIRETNLDVAEDIDEAIVFSKGVTSVETIGNFSPTDEQDQAQAKETNSVQ